MTRLSLPRSRVAQLAEPFLHAPRALMRGLPEGSPSSAWPPAAAAPEIQLPGPTRGLRLPLPSGPQDLNTPWGKHWPMSLCLKEHIEGAFFTFALDTMLISKGYGLKYDEKKKKIL